MRRRRRAIGGRCPPIRHASFAPHVAPDTRLLILGSLPGARSLAERQYYAHPTNQFWRLVGAVIGQPLAELDYDERLLRLRAAKIGLWDVIRTAERRSSSDREIREVEAARSCVAGCDVARAEDDRLQRWQGGSDRAASIVRTARHRVCRLTIEQCCEHQPLFGEAGTMAAIG